MSNTLEVWRCFVSEPMGEKPVTDLAGIGNSLGRKLISSGFDKVNYFSNSIYIIGHQKYDKFKCLLNVAGAIAVVFEVMDF